jgi:orotate phosphoribosyltransferase
MFSDILDSLLELKAIHLAPAEKPYVWTSGWLAPIYCDNRCILSSHEARQKVANGLVALIEEHFRGCEVIAAVATGAIPIGMLVADRMQLPFVYVRPKPKDHGMGNQIEGVLPEGARVVVVEDLVSTGVSSLGAVEALEAAKAQVLGMVAIFTYMFPLALERFAQAHIALHTLGSYPQLLETLQERGLLTAEQQATLAQWMEHPDRWGQSR